MIKVYDNFLPEYYFQAFAIWCLVYTCHGIIMTLLLMKIREVNINLLMNSIQNKECSQKYLDLQETFNIIIQRLNIKFVQNQGKLESDHFNRSGGYHVDNFNCQYTQYTALYYINTNNGCTKLKNNGRVKRVQSIENRMVVFPANIQHQGITCTNKSRRVVINFNFDQHEVSSHL